jgi:small subunit ribosomal protein S16
MVVIRLSRGGAKKRPFYHMVVTDSRKRRDGSYIERIGYFNPIARGQEVRLHIDAEKLSHWQKVGAQLSDRVSALIKEFNKKEKGEAA